MTYLDDQIRATLDERSEAAPAAFDPRPEVRRRLRRRRTRRVALAAVSAAGAGVLAWSVAGAGVPWAQPATPAASSTGTAPTPRPTVLVPRLTRATTPLPTRTLTAGAQALPHRSRDGGSIVTSFGSVPVDPNTAVGTLREVHGSLYYKQGGVLWRRFADGRVTSIAQTGSWVVFSPDGSRYALWDWAAFDAGWVTLRVLSTQDDRTLTTYDLEFRDPPRLRWTSSGLYLLDEGGDAVGRYGLQGAHRVDPTGGGVTPVWTPLGAEVLAPDSGDDVLVVDHPATGGTRVRRWTPGSDEPNLGEGHTLPVRDLALTPDGRTLVSERAVFDATTFEEVGHIDLRESAPLAPGTLDNEYAYALDHTGASRDRRPAVVCRLRARDECFVDPTGPRW